MPSYTTEDFKRRMIKPKPLPLVEELLHVFELSEASPSGLLWKRGKSAGLIAGGIRNVQYWYVKYKKECWACHRIVWALYYGKDPGDMQIDHTDQNKQNNSILNLRLASPADNCHNRKLTSTIKQKKTSTYKGVYWHKTRNKWRARIMVKGKVKELGRFNTEEDAAKAYDLAARQCYGEFAVLNFKDH